VSISRRFFGLSFRLPVLLAAALVSTGFSGNALAQTAPQLLPYTLRLIAGGGTATITKGAPCPVSGLTAADAFGDGCLATEVAVAPSATTGTGARYAVADRTGAVFFSDATNGLIRRVDPITGVITAVAGGAASNPASGTTCGAFTSTDSDGDGCLSTAVKLGKPMGLAFSAAGDLYFADNSFDDVRKVAATAGLVTNGGVITNIAGGSTFGYNVNNTSLSGPVIAATQSFLNFPYGIAFDTAGNLYVADEGNQALEVINLTSASETLQGMTVPAGTIAKFVGFGNLAAKTPASGDCPDFVSTSARGGCYFAKWTDGALGNVSNVDNPYSLAVDSAGNVYFANEFNDNVGIVTPGNVISNYAGQQTFGLKKNQRGPAGSFAISSEFGVALDTTNNLYITDAADGFIWRVDGVGKSMYVIAGGAATVCASATDPWGDGCPGLQAILGSSVNASNATFANTTLPGPGIFGISVDANSNLFFGDTETGLIREMASGTQFGNVGATQTDTVDVHFAANDSAASGGYTITAGSAIFSLGTPACTTNSDQTTDCLLPITATPTVIGPITGTLQVRSQLGGIGTFPLTGNFVQSPITRTVTSAAGTTSCGSGLAYSTTAPITLTASLVANGPSTATGKVIFFANGIALPPTTGVAVTNIGSANNPVYGATLSNTFTTPGTYAITATYSGDGYFKPSTSTTLTSVITALPAFTTSATTFQQSTVAAGQTALYSFNLAQTVYSGTITFAASGLPANSAVSFSPASITANGCSTSNTVAVSILTQQGSVTLSSFGLGGKRPWGIFTTILGLGLALAVGMRRRRAPLRYGTFWMALAVLLATSGFAACGNGVAAAPRTPAGAYTVTITATGSTGTTSIFTVPLKVN
jgi:Bacterial Ig-like domain (group 3)